LSFQVFLSINILVMCGKGNQDLKLTLLKNYSLLKIA
jgi:hypothetical protein